ncbi:MAG TPA: aromatic amino acid transport family protein [Rectinemataceae bacterium]|nr:aromatic amino acid transport family protein [Rectinemataceae bacterium]
MKAKTAAEGADRLGLWQAASIIAGYGIGGGVLALPYLVSLNGLPVALLVILAAYGLSFLLHLMIAELSAGDGTGSQIIELLDRYLFTGKWGKTLTWALFVLMGLAFLANLAAYVAGGREVFASLGMGEVAGSILFYALAAAVAALGLRALGLAESAALAGMAIVFVALAGLTFARVAGGNSAEAAAAAVSASPRLPGSPTLNRILALYGMSMFSFAAFFSVPQAVRGLSDRPRLIVPSVAMGLGINLLVILVVTALALAVPGEVTSVATIGWTRYLGPAAMVLGAIFVTLAMLSSYWSIAQALASILRERLGIGQFAAFLAATLPTLALSFFGGFLGFMRTAGGGIAVLVAVLILPTYAKYRRAREKPAILPGSLDVKGIEWIIAAAYLLMAVGSMVSIG